MSTPITRRSFLRRTGGALVAAVAAPLFIPAQNLDFGVPSGKLLPPLTDDWLIDLVAMRMVAPEPGWKTLAGYYDEHPLIPEAVQREIIDRAMTPVHISWDNAFLNAEEVGVYVPPLVRDYQRPQSGRKPWPFSLAPEHAMSWADEEHGEDDA